MQKPTILNKYKGRDIYIKALQNQKKLLPFMQIHGTQEFALAIPLCVLHKKKKTVQQDITITSDE